MAGVALARYYYPETPLVVIADSGAPMLRDNDKDFVIGDIFMKSAPPIFRDAMLRETADLAQSFPGSFNRFITLGRGHTYMLDVFGMDVGSLL
jgi:hypothetical protein